MLDRRALVVVVLLLVACGGAPAPAPETTPPAPSGVHVSLAPWSITFENDSELELSEDGLFTIDDETIGTLGADGRLVHEDALIATLAPDGSMTLEGHDLAPRIEGERMMEGDTAVLEIDAHDVVHVRAPGGRELTSFTVDGADEEARPTVLFLTAVYLLRAAQAGEDESESADESESEGESALESEDDLWRMPIDEAPSEGPADALVTIVELTDFQCPYCARGAAAMAAIRARFPDDVRLVVRQRPLPFHENARPAAEAALEARAQLGDAGFFRMSALLFANQRSLSRATLESLAAAVGLDLPRFRHALDTQAHEAAIARDLGLGDRMGAEGTPTFYVNGELIIGAQPLASFVHAVERARARAQAALDAGAPRDHLYEAMLADAQDPPPPPEAAPRPHPAAPSDVAHAPAGAHAIEGGGAWLTEHAGAGDAGEEGLAIRIAIWDASGLVLDGSSSPPLRIRLDALEPALAAGLRGIRRGESRRVWLPGSRVVFVEAVDVD